MLDGVGWIATAVFTISYFSKDPAKLRWIQSVAALFWITYGAMIHSKPVIAANIIVAGALADSGPRPEKEKMTAAGHWGVFNGMWVPLTHYPKDKTLVTSQRIS